MLQKYLMQEIEETKVANEALTVFPFLSPSLPFIRWGSWYWSPVKVQSPQFPGHRETHCKEWAGTVRVLPSKKSLIPYVLCVFHSPIYHTHLSRGKKEKIEPCLIFLIAMWLCTLWCLLMHSLLPLCVGLPVLFWFLVCFVSFCPEIGLLMNLWVLAFLIK